jgi:hypothetical protein
VTPDDRIASGTGQTPEDISARDELEGELRAMAARADDPPAEVLAAARAAFTVRDLDAELAVLLLDSWDPDPARPLASVRSEGAPRLLSYALRHATIDLEVTERGGACEVIGHVTGVQPEELELESVHHRTPCRIDALGRFMTRIAPETFRLRAKTAEGPVLTPWSTV